MFQILIVTALCLDAFAAGFSYGIEKTKIPLFSSIIISLICSLVLGLSIAVGSVIKQIIPVNFTNIVCCFILLIIGFLKSFESILKTYILNNQPSSKHISMKIRDINFVLTVYADNLKADSDNSKILSAKEAVYLALALSFDSLAAGLGIGITVINFIQIIFLSFVSNFLAISLGFIFGKYFNKVSNFNLSFLGGLILICLAVARLL